MVAPWGTAGRAEQSGDTANGVATLIAKGASRTGAARPPIRIQAQVLRERQISAATSTPVGFVLSEDNVALPSADETEKGKWRQRDVKRAIAAAEEAGL